MRKALICILGAGVLFTGSASAASTSLDGQIFVVTKGHQTIKLALVNVSAVPEKTFTASLNARVKDLQTQRKALEDDIEKKKAESIARKAALKYDDGTEGSPFVEMERLSQVCVMGPDVDKWSRCIRTPEGKQALEATKVLTAKYKEGMEPANAIRRALRPLMKEHRIATAALREIYSAGQLSTGASDQTKTDADGKFSLSIPNGQRVVILADSSRMVMDNSEVYRWAVWFTAKKGSKNTLFLANDNLLETRCETCVQLVDLRTYPDISGLPEYISIK